MTQKISGPAFSDVRAQHALNFISALTHTKVRWAGKDFQPRPWQAAIIRELFGRMRLDDPLRRAYRTAYIEIPRKNGKSELAAALALYGLVGDKVMGAEVYSAAADREQASLVFNVGAQMVRNDPRLSARLKIIDSQKRIVDHKTGSFYRAISAEAYSKHGFNASMVIFDELHASPNRQLWDVLATSMGARDEPQMVAITTAGYDRHSICWELHDYAQKVLDGTVTDPTFLPVIYAAPDDADWTDEAVWRACNPALDDFRSIDDMRALAARAREIPALQNVFRRLYLNQWTEQATRWIDMAEWDACKGVVNWLQLREQMKGRRSFAGLDLSTRDDMTALVLLFDQDDGSKVTVPFYWVPEENIRKRSNRDRVPYDQWAREGLIISTPGNQVDQELVRRDVNRICQEYSVQEVGFDPFDASWMNQALQDDGIRIVEMKPGRRDQSSGTKDLGALVVSHKLAHGGHPVLRWNAGNMVVKQTPEGDIYPDKSKITERIDGMTALIDAVSVLTRNSSKEPAYDLMVFGGRH
jgi:phage terminase large subunit-like protein